MANAFVKLIDIYRFGFQDSRLFRRLLLLIGIKLFIMFAILRLIFFPDLLAGKSEREKAATVIENLTTLPAAGLGAE